MGVKTLQSHRCWMAQPRLEGRPRYGRHDEIVLFSKSVGSGLGKSKQSTRQYDLTVSLRYSDRKFCQSGFFAAPRI